MLSLHVLTFTYRLPYKVHTTPSPLPVAPTWQGARLCLSVIPLEKRAGHTMNCVGVWRASYLHLPGANNQYLYWFVIQEACRVLIRLMNERVYCYLSNLADRGLGGQNVY